MLVEGGRAVFPSVSVRDNIMVVTHALEAGASRLDEALELFPDLRPRLGDVAGVLSGGERQMVALARAVVARPTLLMVDELSLGLAPAVMEQLAAALERMTATGMSLLLVEQSLNVAAALADHAYFLEKGEVRFDGAPSELLDRGDLARAVFFGVRRP
jgi:ABC-type branched-subunit amino acid transport system ATPase component